jgi:tRNA/tmRNA/rRNA uracil-C5-methylase (TrmA/RlmC/RlmD family)
LAPGSFWQVHRGAAALLQARVRELSDAQTGQAWWDLYSGAGLFAATLGETVGETGSVTAVEENAESQREARRALYDMPWVRLTRSGVLPWLQNQGESGAAGVVLDPPRAGAGRQVVDQLAGASIPRVVYVACDPVALSRDVARFREHGYGLDHIEAWDLFPMTHHFEVVAVLSRG